MRPACCLVFVQSRDGNTGTRSPSALGGGRTDEHLIYEGLSRVAADAVLAGAETVRDGNVIFSVWHPELVRMRAALGKPRHPLQVIATLQGLAFDRAGSLYVVDAIAGDAALFRIRLDRPHEKERILSGGALIGLAFDGEGRMVVASNDTVYRFAATAKPPAA